MTLRNRDPRTKEELLDRMMSFDFDGDIRHLGKETATVKRLGPNRIALEFPDSGRTYELSVHIPRTDTGETRSFAPPDQEPEVEVEPEKPEKPARGRRAPQPPASH